MPIHLAASHRHTHISEQLTARALEHSAEFAFFEAGDWRPFDSDASRLLGFELAEGVGFATLATATGAHYLVDFALHTQVNVASLFTKSVSWRVLPRGRWNRPPHPQQGLHPGSQDPRLLARYHGELTRLAANGVQVCHVCLAIPPPVPSGEPGYSAAAGGLGAGGSPSPLLMVGSDFDRVQDDSHAANAASGSAGAGGASSAAPSTSDAAAFAASAAAAVVVSAAAATSAALPNAPHISDDISSDVSHSEPGTPLARHKLRPAGDAPDEDESLPRLQVLRSGGEEYNEIAARFVAGMHKQQQGGAGGGASGNSTRVVGGEDGMRPVTVSSVHKVLLPASRGEAFDEAVRELTAARGEANVQLAWHGAPRIALDRIVNDGFSLSLVSRNGRLFGDGVYLAPERRAYTSAEFAVADNEGRKHMLLCRVALGSMEPIPFGSSQRRPSSLRYDTGVDNVADPSRYVVWEEDVNDLVVPTHLVSFRYC
eukprot:TRINITY_DN14609_c0_g1_i2.p1 TRINITY_DN14609_c0_g1~~TRINITY_DN14609_c0_g1_i2.p1  ORF type:complete len:484 (-),score=1.05 TRINITY_DN14609_c0_g1_i2:172-1623(-)